MLVHICCAVDCDYFLRRLARECDEPLVGYFYDPNIHPYSEYLLRLEDAKSVCEGLGIKFYAGEYDYEAWLSGAKGLENEPEKGRRCEFCFDFRMQNTACFARSIGEKKITTTLLMSPKKSHAQLARSLEKICKEQNLEFVAPDFRKNGGTNEQFALAKKDSLYHQNYCGCMFALRAQRGEGEIYELMSPVGGEILPASIEEKFKIYKKVAKFRREGVKFEIIRDEFLNYRLLRAWVKFSGQIRPSFILHNSHFRREFVKFSINESCEKFYCDKGEIKILSLKFFNEILKTDFKNTAEILKNPPSLKKQEQIRAKICGARSLSPIIVVDEIYPAKVEIYALSRIFLDVREILVKLG
ncbi:epoxyqueuosine reductase QueH [Campylobacter sp. JMF_01 NE2]|uniref:epoxyqueuosine reductase QueH n=1 Tax=unclassified Campylobacter TaxID=2593542 RepID=UPI0022E9C579|nr:MULTISPECIES: epoxyqueuosine reductase QueH [unclassified Campylobacter]MDA3053644.1 epoxyqueuosine reductase QueH [Campylobacter sp. JMF_03 NE3]MDA3067860.1 epoxyqueuosine reductase QueH [Campylobacter sp. JMF_01 NE2]